MYVVRVIQGFGQRFAFIFEMPGCEFPWFHAKGNGSDEGRCRNPALVVTKPGITGFNLPLFHAFGDTKRRHQQSRLKNFQANPTIGYGRQRLGYIKNIVPQGGEVGAKGNRYSPINLLTDFRE